MKSNKHVDSLRRTPLPFPDLCTKLFEGATSTGMDSWGPSSTLPRPSQDLTQYSLHDFDDIDCTQKEVRSPPLNQKSERLLIQQRVKKGVKMHQIQECLKLGKILRRLQRYLWISMFLQIWVHVWKSCRS